LVWRQDYEALDVVYIRIVLALRRHRLEQVAVHVELVAKAVDGRAQSASLSLAQLDALTCEGKSFGRTSSLYDLKQAFL